MGHKFERYCKDYENIENYEAAKKDDFIGWHCHHRLETHTPDGKRRDVDIGYKELIALGMYYNVSSEELIFMTRSDHTKLHKKGNTYRLGKYLSEEVRNKISRAHKGKYASEETRKKMSESRKGKRHTEECKKKIGAAHKGNTYVRGRHWYNNGKENKYCYECPDGFIPGMLNK